MLITPFAKPTKYGYLKYILAALITFSTALILASCAQQPALHELDGLAEGTTYHITWWADHGVDQSALSNGINRALAQIDKEISNYRSDSDIARFNHSRSTNWQSLPADVINLLAIEQVIYHKSAGCYDPTIGPLFNLWGFRKGTPHIPSPRQITAVRREIGFNHIEIDAARQRVRKTIPQLAIDMNSVGEGYSIWRLAQVLEHHHIHDYIVEFGGDMLVKGRKPGHRKWRIAIARPVPGTLRPQDIITINNRDGVSINTSGTYRRFFDVHGKTYSHILDPRTGSPVTHNLVSATVFGTDPRVGDAWATAMLCMGEAKGEAVAKTAGIKVMFIQEEDGTLVSTESSALRNTTTVTVN